MLPGSWQTSRQSAYSMATRCAEELHVYLDTQTQQTGPYHHTDPVQALGERWTRGASKVAASLYLNHPQERDRPTEWSTVDDTLIVAPPEPHEPAPARSVPELTAGSTSRTDSA